MVNPEWHHKFPEAEALFLEPGASDHSLILVHLGIQLHIGKPPFRFFSLWFENPAFEDVVFLAWDTQISGSPQVCLTRKLKGLKGLLKQLNKTEYDNLPARTDEARDALLQIQRLLLQQHGSEDLKVQENLALEKLVQLSVAEERFFKQKCRIRWIKEGDSNTSFFHNSVKARFNRNKILSRLLENGSRIHEQATIHAAAVSYFENLFTYPSPSYASSPPLSSFISKTISPGQALDLTRRVTGEEIRDTVFRMKPDKAPGPDGFSIDFFQKSWHIVGVEVVSAISSFFDCGRLLKELNHKLCPNLC